MMLAAFGLIVLLLLTCRAGFGIFPAILGVAVALVFHAFQPPHIDSSTRQLDAYTRAMQSATAEEREAACVADDDCFMYMARVQDWRRSVHERISLDIAEAQKESATNHAKAEAAKDSDEKNYWTEQGQYQSAIWKHLLKEQEAWDAGVAFSEPRPVKPAVPFGRGTAQS